MTFYNMDLYKMTNNKYGPFFVVKPELGDFQIYGKSLIEDVSPYLEFIEAIKNKIAEKPQQKIVLTFNIDFCDTASSKILLDIILLLEDYAHKGGEVTVNWCYDEDEEFMYDEGLSFKEMTDLPFHFIAK